MDLINARIKSGAAMSEAEFFARELTEWKSSQRRRDMLESRRYYRGDQDVLRRKRMVIGREGREEEAPHLPNNRIVDNQYAKLVDQKKNYLLGKPISFLCSDKRNNRRLSEVFDCRFQRVLKLAGEEAIRSGIAYLYPYLDGEGVLSFRMFPSYEIYPFWKDAARTELDCALRLYETQVYEGREKKTVERAELYRLSGMSSFIFEGGRLYPQGEEQPYIKGESGAFNWTRIPLIPIKSGAAEIPLLNRVRQLQDALNLLSSDLVNSMEENVHNTVLVLKNYDGTDLGEFRRNLAVYGAVKVRTVEGSSGGVDTLKVEVRAEDYKSVCQMLKRSIVENARGYDAKDERMYSSPNQMNIQSMYADMDLDANDMETQLQAAFEQMLWFAGQWMALRGDGGFDHRAVQVIFNRDVLINESEAIDNCRKSVGILSEKTIVAQHPWTVDVEKELKQQSRKDDEGA